MASMTAYIRLHHFYALLEAEHSPRLRHQPFIVTQGRKIIDVSPEAAKLQITVAMGIRQARLACPALQVVEAEADPLPAAERFWDICAGLSPSVEPESHNSAFMGLTLQDEIRAVSDKIANRLTRQLGVPFYLCIAPNKLTAKIAYLEAAALPPSVPRQKPLTWHQGRGRSSAPLKLKGRSKPKANTSRCLIISPDLAEDFLAPLSVNRLWPWPDKIHQQLQNLGIYTIGQLRQVPRQQLQRLFGETGKNLHDAARGIDPAPVKSLYPPETIQGYFQLPPEMEGCRTWEELTKQLLPIVESSAQELSRQGQACTRLRLMVEYKNLEEKCWDKPLKNELQTADQLLLAIKSLLAAEAWPAPITGVRLMLMGLKPAALGQLALASYLKPQRPRELEQLLSSLQAKFGADRVFIAADISIPRRERMLQLLTGFGDNPINSSPGEAAMWPAV
ncbi:MAG: hypothetical protein GX341_07715 [Firmicutes bacterium]|jgi:DNA polymerase-4|nr:hypothetical protein [Bacillota bacterium]